MELLKKLYRYARTQFGKLQLLAVVAIIVYVFLISENNIFVRWGYDAEIMKLEDQIEYYREQTEINTRKLEELDADKDEIEKFARENYLMKKADEDVFIIE